MFHCIPSSRQAFLCSQKSYMYTFECHNKVQFTNFSIVNGVIGDEVIRDKIGN